MYINYGPNLFPKKSDGWALATYSGWSLCHSHLLFKLMVIHLLSNDFFQCMQHVLGNKKN